MPASEPDPAPPSGPAVPASPARPAEEVDAALVAALGATGVILVFVLIIGLQVLFRHMDQQELERKYISQPPLELLQLQAWQRGQLADYRWVDKKKGVVAIPIDRAMELVVREQSAPAPVPAAPAEEKR